MKKFLLTALLGVAALSASAATETFTYSYVKEPCTLGAYGYNGLAQTYGAAMGFYAPSYAGMKIVKIDAYLNLDAAAIKNVSNTSVFMSTNLPAMNTNQKPNILSAPVTPVETTWKVSALKKETVAVMSYELETPYVITPDPIYVGYYLHVDKVAGTAERYPILIDKDVTNEPGSFFYVDEGSVEDGQWTDAYTSSGAVMIILTIEREVFDNALSVSTPETIYAEVGKNFDALMQVSNNGLSTVNTITYKYALDGAQEVTNTLTLDEPLASGIGATYDVLFPINAIETTGEYIMDFEITELNGVANESPAGATFFEVDVFPYMPVRMPLVEEYTSLNCGYCPRGYVAMEYLREEYPEEMVGICYHLEFNTPIDPMTVTAAPPIAGATSYPTASIDRMAVIDPYYGDWKTYGYRDIGIVDDIFRRINEKTFADIQINNVTVVDSVINFNTDVTFMKSVDNDAYRIAYVLTCDGMYSPEWVQTNYYSRDASVKDTPLIQQFYTLPGKVYGLTFNDVAINTTNYRGIQNSLTNIEAGVPVTLSHKFDVKNVQNLYKTSLNPYVEIDYMTVIAFIVDRSNGRVLNAAKHKVGKGYDAVESIEADGEAVSTVYYDLAGRRVANPEKGIFIKSVKYENGAVRTEKIVK